MVNATSKSSRLIGYYQLHPYVIPLPSTMSLQLTDDDEFIVLANAAFWACTSPEEVVSHIRHIDDAKMAASKLRDLALAYGSKEEVSILVIFLSHSKHYISRHILSASNAKNSNSPLLCSGSNLRQSSTSKLSRPKTFHGEADLHYNTASLSRIKQATAIDPMEPSIKHSHSKSVKDLYSKPAAQVDQPKVITSYSSDKNLVKTTLQNVSPQVGAKKKPSEQNGTRKSDTKDSISDNRKTSPIASESIPPSTQLPFEFKTSQNKPDPQLSSHEPQPTSHDPQPISHDPQLLSHDPQPTPNKPLSHSSSYSTVADQDSEAQSLNESANPTWFESLPPMQFGDSYSNDTFGLELGMISETKPSSTDNVVLSKRDVDQGWVTRNRSYTQPHASTRDTDRDQAKANFNFDELLAGLNNAWMTTIPSLPEDNTTGKQLTPTKSTMTREDSLFLDNSTLMEQFDQPVDETELNNLISQLNDFVNDTS